MNRSHLRYFLNFYQPGALELIDAYPEITISPSFKILSFIGLYFFVKR